MIAPGKTVKGGGGARVITVWAGEGVTKEGSRRRKQYRCPRNWRLYKHVGAGVGSRVALSAFLSPRTLEYLKLLITYWPAEWRNGPVSSLYSLTHVREGGKNKNQTHSADTDNKIYKQPTPVPGLEQTSSGGGTRSGKVRKEGGQRLGLYLPDNTHPRPRPEIKLWQRRSWVQLPGENISFVPSRVLPL